MLVIRPTWTNLDGPRVKFFEPIPKLAHPPTGTSPNWHFPQLTLHSTRTSRNRQFFLRCCVHFVFIHFDIADLQMVLFIEHFFILGLILKSSSYTKTNFQYFINFSEIC